MRAYLSHTSHTTTLSFHSALWPRVIYVAPVLFLNENKVYLFMHYSNVPTVPARLFHEHRKVRRQRRHEPRPKGSGWQGLRAPAGVGLRRRASSVRPPVRRGDRRGLPLRRGVYLAAPQDHVGVVRTQHGGAFYFGLRSKSCAQLFYRCLRNLRI